MPSVRLRLAAAVAALTNTLRLRKGAGDHFVGRF